jgi:hypothetical protein
MINPTPGASQQQHLGKEAERTDMMIVQSFDLSPQGLTYDENFQQLPSASGS